MYLPGSLTRHGNTTVAPVGIRYVCPGVIKFGNRSGCSISNSFKPVEPSAPVKKTNNNNNFSFLLIEIICVKSFRGKNN